MIAKAESLHPSIGVSASGATPTHWLRLMALQAVMVTLLMGAAAYFALGRPALLGIDDANITQVYASNIAAGRGYVYQAGHERVEGSTSFAWTLLNALSFLISNHPEWLIAGLSAILCALAVFFTLRLADSLASVLEVSRSVTNGVTLLAIAATPAFFAWEIWTLMDLVLWTALLAAFAHLLVKELLSEAASRGRTGWLALCAAALVLTRPEGIALALVMLAASAWLSRWGQPKTWSRVRPYLIAGGAALVCLGLLTFGRQEYFGYPVPNTFYAKVSSSPMRQLAGGLHYLVGFVSKSPYCVLYLSCWAGLLSVCFANRAAVSKAGFASVALIAITMVAMLALYVALGGDHFPLYRFYQPLSLWLPLGLALSCAYLWPRAAERFRRHPASRAALALAAGLAVFSALGGLVSSGVDLRLQFDIGMDGRRIAERLQQLPHPPSVGVIAAGGFAREYPGETFDLMGLNWVKMAHADPLKTGKMRNHAGFSPAVFWQTRPELVAFTGNRCNGDKTWGPDQFERTALKSLQSSPQFLAEYQAVKVDCYLAFARKELIARLGPQAALVPVEPIARR